MARILENYSLNLLEKSGLEVVNFKVAKTPEEVADYVLEIKKEVVIKALVPVGKRGKAGAVKFASNPTEAKEAASSILGTSVGNYPVEEVIVAEKIKDAKELYVSISIDKKTACPVIVFSINGGIDIEEIAEKFPEKVVMQHINPLRGLLLHQSIELLENAGLKGIEIRKVANALQTIYKVFVSYDCTLLEINPIFLTNQGEVIVPACVLKIDDSAMFRQKDLVEIAQKGSERAWRPLTEIEKKVKLIQDAEPYRGTARYTEMDGGNIGFMCGGGGGSLVLYDELIALGGEPANYTEFGGNPTEEKVYNLALNILSKPGVRGLFVSHNITNNTQVDVEARGIVRAIKEKGLDPKKFPIVVRAPGVNETEGFKIFEDADIEYYGDDITMTDSARKMVEKMKKYFNEVHKAI